MTDKDGNRGITAAGGVETVRVGLITRAVGVRGEVSVLPLTDDPARFRELGAVFLEAAEPDGGELSPRPPGRPRQPRFAPAEIEGVRFHKGRPIVRLKGCDSAEAAAALRGRYIAITRDMLAPLDEGSFYIFELIGCEVFNMAGERLGEIRDVLATGSNDVYVVGREGRGDVLIPALKSVILEVDTSERRVLANWAPP